MEVVVVGEEETATEAAAWVVAAPRANWRSFDTRTDGPEKGGAAHRAQISLLSGKIAGRANTHLAGAQRESWRMIHPSGLTVRETVQR